MTLYHIHLVMARNKEFPDGNLHRGYDIHAPLDADGHLDKQAWEKSPSSSTVMRFWDGERSELGYLVNLRGLYLYSMPLSGTIPSSLSNIIYMREVRSS